MSWGSQSAVAAALAVARAQGLGCVEPVVLREAWHVLVHLSPLPIVARVSTSLPFPEGPRPDDLVRELDVAAHAARAGAPVVPPAEEVEPVPHRCDGRIVTFWRYVEPHDPADPRAAGRALSAIHDALEDYHRDLPAAGHPDETGELLASLEPGAATEVIRLAVSNRPDVDGQALHGDAHLDNCLGSPAGPLWHDFETACRGPREYDLAALMSRDRIFGPYPPAREALAAYGTHDAELVNALLPVYVAWVSASMLTALPRRPELAGAIEARVRWLSQR
jgi:Ser/Thr protein kinase RdoA (MazF antagonist)